MQPDKGFLLFIMCESMMRLTCDLHQRINISATILKSSLESASGSFNHLDLQQQSRNNKSSFTFSVKSALHQSASSPEHLKKTN